MRSTAPSRVAEEGLHRAANASTASAAGARRLARGERLDQAAHREPALGLWRRILCRLGLHRRVRLATPDPTLWREVCTYCGDARCDVDEVD